MARLPDQILTAIFSLQRQLVEGINEAAATELAIFEQFGETEITITSTRATPECQATSERALFSSVYTFA